VTYEIPVFLLPTSRKSFGEDPTTEAEAAIAGAVDGPDDELLYDTSTGWWRPELARSLAAAWRISGLDFLAKQVILLSPAEAAAAARASEEILARLRVGSVPELPDAFDFEVQALSSADLASLLAVGRPVWRGEPADHDVTSFIGFLLAMAAIARRASQSGLQLLFYRPDP
jgi:hypothetical protein